MADAPGERCIAVKAGSARYDVIVGAGCLRQVAEHIAAAAPGVTGIALVADAGLPREVGAAVEASLGSLTPGPVATLTIEPSEQVKTLATLERVCAHLAAARLERAGGLVVALGGGIVGDIAGFAAATYRRGVRVVQCPTTLLAMVDASVGGKTGVNLATGGSAELRKNFIGAFHQPSLVVADVAVLGSLGDRDFRCGLAECFKHGMISADWGDPELLAWTEGTTSAILERRPEALVELVARNVAVKASVVATDERETAAGGAGTSGAGRALLNLGHTFAHAIETIPGAAPAGRAGGALPDDGPPLRHGEAVALGLIAASRLSERLGLGSSDLAGRIERAVESAGLPTAAQGLPPSAQVRAQMAHDKKAAGGRMRLIVPLPGARATVIDEPAPGAIEAAIDTIRAGTDGAGG